MATSSPRRIAMNREEFLNKVFDLLLTNGWDVKRKEIQEGFLPNIEVRFGDEIFHLRDDLSQQQKLM